MSGAILRKSSLNTNKRNSKLDENYSNSDRAYLEYKIALNNLLDNDTPIVQNLDLPTVICDYYLQSVDHSIHREGFGDNLRDINDNGVKYIKIKGLVLYGIPDNLIESNDKDDERGTQLRLTQIESILLPNVFQPLAGDRLVLQAYGPNLVFKLNKWEPGSLKEKPFYNLYYVKDPECSSVNDLESSVIATYIFKLDNVGTNRRPLLLEENESKSRECESLAIRLMNEYTDCFYDSTYNILSYGNTSNGRFDCINFTSLNSFQEIREVLKYRGKNTLFVYSPESFKLTTDYNRSIYNTLFNKRYREIQHISEDEYLNQFNKESFMFKALKATLDDNYLMDKFDKNHNYKNDYWFNLFYGPYSAYCIFSPMRGFNGSCTIMRSTPVEGKECSFDYHLTSNIIRRVLDDYLTNGNILKSLQLLDYLNISEDNMDHFLFIPFIIELLFQTSFSLEVDIDKATQYGGSMTWIK